MDDVEHGIVIVGGGVCGLATAIALHKNGLRCLILERSDTLRSLGGAIEVYANGWRALDALGVGDRLRKKSLPIREIHEIILDNNFKKEIPLGNDVLRPVKRDDLIHELADEVPEGTIRYGCRVVSIESDSRSSSSLVHLQDGSVIKAKVLIGCDGMNSMVSKSIGNSGPAPTSSWSIGGFTTYEDGHDLGHVFTRTIKRSTIVGRYPINANLVFWYVGREKHHGDDEIVKDREAIKVSALDSVKGFPKELVMMIANCDVDSLFLTQTKYYSPWGLLQAKYTKGTIALAGDSMHGFGPFIGQGGSCAMEDAVALGRCLAQHLHDADDHHRDLRLEAKAVQALKQYVKERRLRVLRLATQSYMIGMLRMVNWLPLKLAILMAVRVLFGHPLSHTLYDCGEVAPTA